MKKFLQYVFVFLLAISLFEILTIIGSIILFNFFAYTNAEALSSSRLIVFELAFCGLITYLLKKRLK